MRPTATARRPVAFEVVQALPDRVMYQVDKVGTFTLSAGSSSWSSREEDPDIVSVIHGACPPPREVLSMPWTTWRDWAQLQQLPTVHRITACGRNTITREVVTETMTQDSWNSMRWGRGVVRAEDGEPCPDGVTLRLRFITCTLAADFFAREDHDHYVRVFRAAQVPSRTSLLDGEIDRKTRDLRQLQEEVDALLAERVRTQADLDAVDRQESA